MPNDFIPLQTNIKTSSGLSSNSSNMNTVEVNDINQFSYSLPSEYTKNKFFTLNGSLMEANNTMGNQESYGEIYKEEVLFDYSLDPEAKKTFILSDELTVVKREITFDEQYYTDDFLQDEVIFNPPPKRTFRL